MNERIKELANRAYRLAYPNTSLYDDNSTRGEIEFEKKFAELIVRECGLIVDELAGGQMGGASSYDLNKHFGVTE
jgi:hypothetical protein